MKEIVVVFEPNKEVKVERHFINDKILYKTLSFVDMCERTDTEYKMEQVPENFTELKELVRQKVKEDNHNGIKKGFGSIEYILIDDKSFLPTGEILDEDNDVFAENRTPQQMWQIIKSLIGEK